ncbi:MAG: aldehyde ferredoxin oxidoreductase family protein [Spirochaetota bacterium]|nr:MAG: aldehyde ferredoxin oxidoreductase family protein [Spirochaetota bacterium]
MKAKGYMGKILRIDLSTRKIETEQLSDEVALKFIGGSGLGAKILYEETDKETDPLGSENPLIFAVGPVNGTKAFNSDRFDVVSKSPLTGVFAESNCGGYWGGKFKRCGYDVMVVKGRAESPVYINIDDNGVEIRDAACYWGRDTFEATEAFKNDLGNNVRAAVIGQAGESLVKYANIISDGKHGRATGRCGLGAVMGSKKLKAIVVNGTKKVGIDNEDGMTAIMKRLGPLMKDDPEALRIGGTTVGLDFNESIGNHPVRNWYQGNWKEGAKKITGMTMVEKRLVKRYHCGQCVINCGRVVKASGGPFDGQEIAGPEYETMSLLGSNCLVDDLDAVIKTNELCNRYGLDTISTGNCIGFAMEAFERGYITKNDADGLELSWGNAQAVIELVKMIGKRKAVGKLLGEGVRRAANELGGFAPEFALEVKGLEPPAHDPRAHFSVGLGLATSNRGACHLAAFTHDFEASGTSIGDLGSPPLTKRFITDGRAENVFRMQHLMSMLDSLTFCKFILFGNGLAVQPCIDYLNCITGWDFDPKEFFKTGERLFNLKRLYNNRLGISRKDDTLPQRMLYHKKEGTTNELPPLNLMLNEYYKLRGWDEFGIPTEEKLKELGLEEYIQGKRM